jgi:hypothetical protein
MKLENTAYVNKINIAAKTNYHISSTKLEKRAEQVLPGNEGDGGRNDPNNVCTYE